MNILFFLEYYHPNIGGVETLFKNLVEHLAQNGNRITIITARPYPDCPLKEEQGNISIIRIPVRSRYIFTFLGFFYLIRYIRRGDFIHSTSYNAAIPAFFAGKLFRKKVIITFHEVWDQLWFQLPDMSRISRWGHYLFEQFLLKLPFDKFIGVSKSTTDNLIKAGIDKNRVVTIYNGINYDAFSLKKRPLPKSKDTFVFTYFGRLGISKGLDLLIPAAQKICSKYEDVQLQLIIPKVPKPFLEELLQQINRSILQSKTVIRHELPYALLKKQLVSSDCVVIPSYSEGFCFAAVECIAMDVPIISSDRAALKEVVSGQFIKMDTFSTKGLTEAMEKAYLGDWEYTPIRQFELKNTIQQYTQLYQEINGIHTTQKLNTMDEKVNR